MRYEGEFKGRIVYYDEEDDRYYLFMPGVLIKWCSFHKKYTEHIKGNQEDSRTPGRKTMDKCSICKYYKDTEKYNRQKDRVKIHIKDISDSYIKGIYKSLGIKYITNEMIEYKRQQILLKRKIKEISNEKL